MQKVININSICKTFSDKYYSNNQDDILYDIFEFTKKLRSEDKLETYDIIKGFKAILAYCGNKQVDLNRFFKLKIE